MKQWLATALTFVLISVSATQADAQEGTLGDLKTKGAKVLSAEEIKELLTGATVRFESDQFAMQMKLDASGSIAGSAVRRIGGSYTATLGGKCRITDNALWCGETQVIGGAGGGAKWCRSVLRLGDKHYFIYGPVRDDTRPAFEMSVTR